MNSIIFRRLPAQVQVFSISCLVIVPVMLFLSF